MLFVYTPCFLTCIVSFQIIKLENVESIWYRKKIFVGALDHENIFTQTRKFYDTKHPDLRYLPETLMDAQPEYSCVYMSCETTRQYALVRITNLQFPPCRLLVGSCSRQYTCVPEGINTLYCIVSSYIPGDEVGGACPVDGAAPLTHFDVLLELNSGRVKFH